MVLIDIGYANTADPQSAALVQVQLGEIRSRGAVFALNPVELKLTRLWSRPNNWGISNHGACAMTAIADSPTDVRDNLTPVGCGVIYVLALLMWAALAQTAAAVPKGAPIGPFLSTAREPHKPKDRDAKPDTVHPAPRRRTVAALVIWRTSQQLACRICDVQPESAVIRLVGGQGRLAFLPKCIDELSRLDARPSENGAHILPGDANGGGDLVLAAELA